jgi:hypothetical protein
MGGIRRVKKTKAVPKIDSYGNPYTDYEDCYVNEYVADSNTKSDFGSSNDNMGGYGGGE